MNVPPKWAMMFSVCIPIIGQFIFVYVVYQAYVNLQFIRPETRSTLLRDVLLCLLTFGLMSFIVIPRFFREVDLGGKRLNVVMPNYFRISSALVTFIAITNMLLLSLFETLIGLWILPAVTLTYLFIDPFEKVRTAYADYM